MVASLFVGIGPGGLKSVDTDVQQSLLNSLCLPGASHGGVVSNDQTQFQVGGPYDKENLKTFRGGSGGDTLFFQYLSFFFLFTRCLPYQPLTHKFKAGRETSPNIFVTTPSVIQAGQKYSQLSY